MAKFTIIFSSEADENLFWVLDVGPQVIEDLRTLPERAPPGFVPAGSNFATEVLNGIQLLVDEHRNANAQLLPQAQSFLTQAIAWWLLWEQVNPEFPRAELHRRFGREPLQLRFKRQDDRRFEITLNWSEFVQPEDVEMLGDARPPDTLNGWLQHFREANLAPGEAGDQVLELLRLAFIAGVHAIHHAHTREGGLPLDVLSRQYRDDPIMQYWCTTHRDGHREAMQAAGTPRRLRPRWMALHDEVFWTGAAAALHLSLNLDKPIGDIESEAQAWRGRVVHDSDEGPLRGRLAQRIFREKGFTETLRRNPNQMARHLDRFVGRGNWRYDTRQRSWLLRQAYPDGVSWAAIDPAGLGTWRALDPAEAASWWQRLAAGDTPMEMPLLTQAIQWLSEDRNLRREYQQIIGPQYHYKITRRQWQVLIDNARRLGRRLTAANKFKCESGKGEFSERLREVAEEPPFALLHERLVTARLPYESGDCWIEWQRADGKVWGVLIMPGENGTHHRAVIVHPDGRFEFGCLLFDFRQPVTIRDGYTISETTASKEFDHGYSRWQVLGNEYCRRWLYSERAALDELAKHAVVNLSSPLYGERPTDLFRRDDTKQQEEMAARTYTIGGVFRELLACCAEAVTHVDDEPLTSHVTVTAPPFKARGKFHPPYEYKQITWRRPQELPRPRKVRRVVRSGAGLPLHKCSGHWRHRRKPNDICSLHPRACALAQWCSVKHPETLWGHDDGPLSEEDYQICVRCKRARWWVRDHERGNAANGVVDKSYRIVASTGRRRRPP